MRIIGLGTKPCSESKFKYLPVVDIQQIFDSISVDVRPGMLSESGSSNKDKDANNGHGVATTCASSTRFDLTKAYVPAVPFTS